MKVKELIDKLGKLDPSLELICWIEEKEFEIPGHPFRLLEIVAVDVVEGELRRGEDQIPSMKIEKTPLSSKLAVIEVTADF